VSLCPKKKGLRLPKEVRDWKSDEGWEKGRGVQPRRGKKSPFPASQAALCLGERTGRKGIFIMACIQGGGIGSEGRKARRSGQTKLCKWCFIIGSHLDGEVCHQSARGPIAQGGEGGSEWLSRNGKCVKRCFLFLETRTGILIRERKNRRRERVNS